MKKTKLMHTLLALALVKDIQKKQKREQEFDEKTKELNTLLKKNNTLLTRPTND